MSSNDTKTDDHIQSEKNAQVIKKTTNKYKKIRCECGAAILKCNISHHIKSKKHTSTLDLMAKGLL